jgi:hypothetical protein
MGPSAKVILVDKLARRYGFKLVAGLWRKEWPSGKEWSFTVDGRNPVICDEYGRIIRTAKHGITVIGMFASLKAGAPWRGEIGNRQPRKAKRVQEPDE